MAENLGDLLSALGTAPPERRKQALLVLRGEAVAVEPGAEAPVFEPYLSRSALARQLGVSPWSVWRWQPPSHDVGDRPRFLLSEVRDYLRSEAFSRRRAALRAERRQVRRANIAAVPPKLAA